MDRKKVYRLIDANLNRAREGMRVIEDASRFILDDGRMYRRIRALRHRLGGIFAEIYPSLVDSRDSIKDSGRCVREGPRKNVCGLVAANFRRAEEALRVLEEYSKLVSAGAGAAFKALRYKMYSYEKDMLGHL